MLARLSQFALAGLMNYKSEQNATTPNQNTSYIDIDQSSQSQPESGKKTASWGPPQKVATYARSDWLVNTDNLEVRMALLYDLETEFETIQENLMELLTSFTMHWAIRGVVTGLLTMEVMDLFYVKL